MRGSWEAGQRHSKCCKHNLMRGSSVSPGDQTADRSSDDEAKLGLKAPEGKEGLYWDSH